MTDVENPEVIKSEDTQKLTTPPSTSQEVIQQQASNQDYVILRFAVVGLTIIALVCIMGSLYLLSRIISREGDVAAAAAAVAGVMGLGGVAVGGLVTMLTRVPLIPFIPPPQVKSSIVDRRQS